MPERHSVDFRQVSFNIISDAERGTITLQYPSARGGSSDCEVMEIRQVLRSLKRRYGGGIGGRLGRWYSGMDSPFVLPSCSEPHPTNPDVLCFEIRVRQGERLESALATFLEFARQQPGYQRTFGAPLDRDEIVGGTRYPLPGYQRTFGAPLDRDSKPSRARKMPSGNIPNLACDVLRNMIRRPGKEAAKEQPWCEEL